MATSPEDISEISDVGYLVTLLRIAGKKRDHQKREAILSRLRNMGVLNGEGMDKDPQKQNLKSQIDRILKAHET